MTAAQHEGAAAPFDIAIRGYDRRQVEERLAYLTAELVATDDALRQSEMRAAELNEQLRIAVGRLRHAGGAATNESFGFRVEKILRLAEEEARELRSHGAADAAALVERATADAAATVERARAEAGALRIESERIRAEAHRDAERMLTEAHARAAALTAHVDMAIRREALEVELRRLSEGRALVLAELRGIHQLLDPLLPARPTGSAAPAAPTVAPVASPASPAASPASLVASPASSGASLGRPSDSTQPMVPTQTGPTT